MATNATFGGQSIQSFDGSHGILLSGIEHAGKSAKQAQNYVLSHAHRSIIPYVEYPMKPITLTGQIIGTSISDEDTQIDTFNQIIAQINAPLVFDYAGGSLNRQYLATAQVPNVSRPGGLAWADFNVTFIATLPYGQDVSATTLLSSGSRTLGGYSDNFTFGGNFPFQLPTITITFSAVSDTVNPQTVSLGNASTGQQLNITRVWAATDVLVVDCTFATNIPVTINALPVNFTGGFPDFAVSPTLNTGTLTYSDSFTTRTFTELVTYYKYYL